MTRREILAGLFGAAAAPVAGVLAKTFDAENEPIPATAALIAVNAPGTTIQNVHIDGRGSRRTAIRLSGQALPVENVAGNIVLGGDL